MKLPQHVSESTKKRNPDFYGMGASSADVGKHSQETPLVESPQAQSGDRTRLESVVVSLVIFRHRKLDSDNSIAGGTKALRDAIARELEVDDADPRIRWEYEQVETKATPGVLVRIQGQLCQHGEKPQTHKKKKSDAGSFT